MMTIISALIVIGFVLIIGLIAAGMCEMQKHIDDMWQELDAMNEEIRKLRMK